MYVTVILIIIVFLADPNEQKNDVKIHFKTTKKVMVIKNNLKVEIEFVKMYKCSKIDFHSFDSLPVNSVQSSKEIKKIFY